jgi:hypothetical protein
VVVVVGPLVSAGGVGARGRVRVPSQPVPTCVPMGIAPGATPGAFRKVVGPGC